MPTFVPAIEIIYRDLARPRAPDGKTARVEAAKKTELTRSDVDAILQRKRGALADELQQIISDAKEYRLTPGERNQLSVDLTMQIAHARQSNGRRDNPGERFIAQVLGLIETPYGLLARSFIDDLLRAGSENISRCRLHCPPLCDCWSRQRAILFQASANEEKSPEGWAATRIYSALEELEMATRPERQANSTMCNGYSDGYQDGSRPAYHGH